MVCVGEMTSQGTAPHSSQGEESDSKDAREVGFQKHGVVVDHTQQETAGMGWCF